MNTGTPVRPLSFPSDRGLPGAAELLGAAGADRVSRFLAERGLEPRRVEPVQAHYRPGRWLAVCCRTAAVDRSSGRPVCLTVTVECRADQPDQIWAFPDDPGLPGLAAAADGQAVLRRLHPRPDGVTVEPLRYRPRRRAVLRYRLGRRVLYGKVVTPRRGRQLLERADALRSTGLRLAVPIGRIAPGALLMPRLPGTPLRDLLLAGGPIPAPEQVVRLTVELHHRCEPLRLGDPGTGGHRTAGGDGGGRRRVDPSTALAAAQVVARLVPAEAGTAARLAEAVIGWAEGSEPPDDRVVHGDLYENQILVDGDALGLIDLDDLGPGDPLLDAANFTAHLFLLGTSIAPSGATILRYRDELIRSFCHRLDADPAELAWREAYCLLRLASGPFRVLHPDWPRRVAHRVALATQGLAMR